MEGQGSTFTLTLPMSAHHSTRLAAPTPVLPETPESPGHQAGPNTQEVRR